MLIDASVIVAILAREDDADALLQTLADAGPLSVSPLSIFEATAGLARRMTNAATSDQHPVSPAILDIARDAVIGFVAEIGAQEIALAGDSHRLAFHAMRTYGKLVAHPARLNFGDCFVYACAKANDLPLLYKGDDFAHTDLA